MTKKMTGVCARVEVKEGLPEKHEEGVCGSTGFGFCGKIKEEDSSGQS